MSIDLTDAEQELEWQREAERLRLPYDPSYTRFNLRDIDVCRSSLLFIEPYRDPYAWKALFVFDLFDRRGLPDVYAWCEQHFGKMWPENEGRWHAADDYVVFESEADGFLFKLKWG